MTNGDSNHDHATGGDSTYENATGSDSAPRDSTHAGSTHAGLTYEQQELLTEAVMPDDPTDTLWEFVNSGTAQGVVPELPALHLEQDPVHRHKDVLSHTIAVTAKTSPDLTLRLGALFHDIGKPATRTYSAKGVSFHNHEAVGAKMTRRRLRTLGYPPQVVKDVSELVRLSGRFKGYAKGWGDSAVRRYVRDAGHLFGLLNELIRCDCTTQNPRTHARLQQLVSELENRVQELARVDSLAAERPLLDGQDVMELLELKPGPQVGAALQFLLDLKRSEPDLNEQETESRLQAWWQQQQG